jgi:hypothetical protein
VTLQVEFWTLVSISVSFLGAVIGIVWGLIRGVLAQGLQRIDEHFAALERAQATATADFARRLGLIESAGREESAQWTRIERELLQLKADLPISYVRREDYVQSTATIMSKLDAMSIKFENILLKGGRPHE